MIKKRKEDTPNNQQPQENNYTLGMGSQPHTTQSGGFLGTTVPVKHSERRPLSLEEAGREKPGNDDILYGLPGVRVVKTRTQLFSNESRSYYDI